MEAHENELRNELATLIPRLRRFAMTLTSNIHDSDDLVQNAIERALKNLNRWERGTRLDSWMFRIMQNLWIDQYRANQRRDTGTSIDDLPNLSGEDGRQVTENQLMVRDMELAITKLSEEQRSLVVLVLVEGMSYREAAKILNTPIGTVMSRLARARKTLAEQLQPGGV
ncbi:MAG: RNA polymerase sigma factor [Gammaproteobacteria bacterium]|nr:RNA polymerase sigma factor [Gammaproteobacteria bacterium]